MKKNSIFLFFSVVLLLIIFNPLKVAKGQSISLQNLELKSESDSEALSSISLTMVFVPETFACRPDGYVGRVGRTCERLTQEEFDNFTNQYPNQTQQLQSSNYLSFFNLGADLFSRISHFYQARRTNPYRRFAIVIYFDFGPRHEEALPVEIHRKKGESNYISVYTHTLRSNHHGFIYHARAEDFYPPADIEWKLVANSSFYSSSEWRFKLSE
jgi:hypothetical protein